MGKGGDPSEGQVDAGSVFLSSDLSKFSKHARGENLKLNWLKSLCAKPQRLESDWECFAS
jgi:hypothetical protein